GSERRPLANPQPSERETDCGPKLDRREIPLKILRCRSRACGSLGEPWLGSLFRRLETILAKPKTVCPVVLAAQVIWGLEWLREWVPAGPDVEPHSPPRPNTAGTTRAV